MVPIAKKAALENPTAAQELFDNLSSLIPPTDIKIFTDGSVTRNPNNSSCAYFCPERNLSGSWRLTPGTSIFSAELQGILQALLACYSLEPTPEHIHIFSDSRAAIKALLSPLFPKNRCLNAIRNQIECLRSSGTATSLYWIPSHCGITGNERADKLASNEANSPTGSSMENDLDPGELASICKKSWANSVLSKLKRCKKPCIQIKKNLGLVPWHYSTDRPSSTCLHRLRSGHTYLNSFAHRIDEGADPSCRHGCSAIESPSHILIECQILEPHRLNIKSFFHSEKIHLSIPTLLGLDPTINRKTQLKISNLLTSYLIKSGVRFMA
jgi:ribonuclease HI